MTPKQRERYAAATDSKYGYSGVRHSGVKDWYGKGRDGEIVCYSGTYYSGDLPMECPVCTARLEIAAKAERERRAQTMVPDVSGRSHFARLCR